MTGFTFLSRLTQIAPPHTRFVFPGAGIRLGLPSHPASRRRSCLRLGVSTTSSSRGLSPPSDRPCRAYSRRRAARAAGRRLRRASALGGPARRAPTQRSCRRRSQRLTRRATRCWAVRLPRRSLSCSRPPRLGRPAGVTARSASPNPDPASTRQDSAPVGRRGDQGRKAKRSGSPKRPAAPSPRWEGRCAFRCAWRAGPGGFRAALRVCTGRRSHRRCGCRWSIRHGSGRWPP